MDINSQTFASQKALQYCHSDSQTQYIKENQINDFTLSGSGPLPPALVGDATADIALQFSQQVI
ncbi:MAG TPA: hypothetical protein V6D10_01670 [Trichocoleus sp.]|jgi:hypothetical protein